MIGKFSAGAALALVSALSVETASAASVTIFEDDFNRTTSNVVGAPSAYPSNPWIEDGSGSNVRVVSGSAVPGTTHDSGAMLLKGLSNGDDNSSVNGIFSTNGLMNITLDFDWFASGIENSQGDKLNAIWKVENGSLYLTLAPDMTETSSQTSADWHHESISLPVPLGAEIYIGFYGNFTNSDDSFWIDNVKLTGDDAPLDAPGETPIPGALPLFVSGLGALGLMAHRRKRKQAA